MFMSTENGAPNIPKCYIPGNPEICFQIPLSNREQDYISFAEHRNEFSLHVGLSKVSLVQVCHNFSFSWDISVI